jgi:hypothetical protein
MVWIGFTWLRIVFTDRLISNELLEFIKSRILFDHVSNYQLLKNNSNRWSYFRLINFKYIKIV